MTEAKALKEIGLRPSASHHQSEFNNGERRECIYCLLTVHEGIANQKRQKASFKFVDCSYFLRIERNRNCFFAFHDENFRPFEYEVCHS